MPPQYSKKLFGFLLAYSPNLVFVSILLGIISGLAYTFIIPLIIHAIKLLGEDDLEMLNSETLYILGFEVSNPKYAFTFFGLVMFILICRTISQVILQTVATKATKQLRTEIYKRISQLPIAELERIGSARLLAIITNDIPYIMAGAASFPGIMISSATIFGMLGFLIYLNVDVFLFIMGTIFVGIVSYRIPLYFGDKLYGKARRHFDNIHEGIHGLVHGAKELKLNKTKRESFMEEALDIHEENHSAYSIKGNVFVTLALNYGNLMSFVAIGIATFVLSNHYSVSVETLLAIVMAMLYITGPLSAILNNISPIMRGSVSLRKLNCVLSDMPIELEGGRRGPDKCDSLTFSGVKYAYKNSDNEIGFEVGPINLTLNRGEVSFIVGGNGSGKSTLGKLLTLHYLPSCGEITMGDTLVTDENREQCRQSISAIYSDFYLFTKLYGIEQQELDNLGQYYLEYLALDKKVTIDKDHFSTRSLSDGQKRRLALIVMYLEKRDIYLFDEWAADQDPQFREVFYTQIIPELKKSGKIVIVISHDDRYFYLADNIVEMEDGKLTQTKMNSPVPERLVRNI